MRNLWKGAISFGLLHVPVKLYSATENKDIKFNYLHEKCKTPVQYKKVCPTCNTEVPMEEIVKGYEYEKGKFVILREEDFAKIPLETTKTVQILNFIQMNEIDPIFFEKSYYLAPGDGGQKAYELLKQAMRDTEKAAVAKVIIRSKESLAVLRTYKQVIMMETMFYPEEIRATEFIPEMGYQVQIHENESKMAKNLIDSLTEPFTAEKYENFYNKALHDVIQSKITGEEIETVQQQPSTAKVVDLMETLKASIDLAKKEKDRTKGRTTVKSQTRKTSDVKTKSL